MLVVSHVGELVRIMIVKGYVGWAEEIVFVLSQSLSQNINSVIIPSMCLKYNTWGLKILFGLEN